MEFTYLEFNCWQLCSRLSKLVYSLGLSSTLGQYVNAGQVVLGVAVAWEALFAYDVLIVSLTVSKGYRDRKRHRMSGRNDLVGLIVRDGELVRTSQCSWADLPA